MIDAIKRTHGLLHKLWSNAVGQAGYDKKAWGRLQTALERSFCQDLRCRGGWLVHLDKPGHCADLTNSVIRLSPEEASDGRAAFAELRAASARQDGHDERLWGEFGDLVGKALR